MADSEIHFGLLLILAGKVLLSALYFMCGGFFSTPLKCIPQSSILCILCMYVCMYYVCYVWEVHPLLLGIPNLTPKLSPLSFNFTWSLFFLSFDASPTLMCTTPKFVTQRRKIILWLTFVQLEMESDHLLYLSCFLTLSSSIICCKLQCKGIYGPPPILKRKASLAILVMLACTVCDPSLCKFTTTLKQDLNFQMEFLAWEQNIRSN